MPWYSNESVKPLDYGRPIVAIGGGPASSTFLLMPHKSEKNTYEVIGYNWFDLDKGEFKSSISWQTPQGAVEAYKDRYEINNAGITVKVD